MKQVLRSAAIWLALAGCGAALPPAAAPAPGARAAAPPAVPAVATSPPSATTGAPPHAPQPPAPDASQPPDLHVRCEDRRSCPGAVGMLVFARDPGEAEREPQRCTAALVAPDTVLTAGHCLAPSVRRPGASCAGAWVGFPQPSGGPAQWVECREVISTAHGDAPGTLRQEHALLRLSHPLARQPLAIDRRPTPPGSIVTVVSITPHPVYVHGHALQTRLCRVQPADIATGALGPEAARVGWLSDCPIDHGNSGSPVLDYQGRVRAIVHGGTSRAYALGVTSAVPGVAPAQ